MVNRWTALWLILGTMFMAGVLAWATGCHSKPEPESTGQRCFRLGVQYATDKTADRLDAIERRLEKVEADSKATGKRTEPTVVGKNVSYGVLSPSGAKQMPDGSLRWELPAITVEGK